MGARTKTTAKKAKTSPKRAYHHGDLRGALLAAARDELHEVGWRELSLRSVARRAGATHTAAYHHFQDKAELLGNVAVEGFTLLDTRMKEAMDAAGADPVDRLCAAGLGYVRMASEDPAAYDLMFNGCDFDVSEELRAVGKLPFDRLVAAVHAARAAAGIEDAHLIDEAMFHWEQMHGIALLFRAGKGTFLGLDVMVHTKWVTDRVRVLYAPRAPRVSGT